jgi:hypothetical protein
MNRPLSFRPQVHTLESRDLPALFGVAWLNAEAISFSIVPDGTSAQGVPSNFHAKFGNQAQQAATELAHALDAWHSVANVNFVASPNDDGLGLANDRSFQGGSTRGDVRVAARSLGAGVAAISTPFEPFSPGRGEIILNSDVPFSFDGAAGTYDLRTVLFQEIGHVLGLGNSLNTASVMFEGYQGKRTGLHADDVTAVQALYGIRVNDPYDAVASTEINFLASPAQATGVNVGTRPYLVEASLNPTDTSDTYRFTYKPNLTNTTTTINAGVSTHPHCSRPPPCESTASA